MCFHSTCALEAGTRLVGACAQGVPKLNHDAPGLFLSEVLHSQVVSRVTLTAVGPTHSGSSSHGTQTQACVASQGVHWSSWPSFAGTNSLLHCLGGRSPCMVLPGLQSPCVCPVGLVFTTPLLSEHACLGVCQLGNATGSSYFSLALLELSSSGHHPTCKFSVGPHLTGVLAPQVEGLSDGLANPEP